jgi:hypothetical protein
MYSDNRAPGKPGGAPHRASADQPIGNASLYDRMTLARRAFLDLWKAWAEQDQPSASDVTDEIDATRVVMVQHAAPALLTKGRANAR